MTARNGNRFPVGELIDLLKILRSQALGAPDVAEHLAIDEERGRNVLRELCELGLVVQVAEARQLRRGRVPALYRLAPEWGGA